MYTAPLPNISLIERQNHRSPREKQAVIDWARALLQRDDWIIIDTEATGVKSGAEMVQIAVLSPNNEVLLDTLVKPVKARRMPSEAFAKHGITIKELKDAPTFRDIAPQLKELIQDRMIVSYNTEYRIRLLKESFEQSGYAVPSMRSVCAMIQYSKYAGEWWDSKSDYKWQPLPGSVHKALGDCRATLALIRNANGTKYKTTVRPI